MIATVAAKVTKSGNRLDLREWFRCVPKRHSQMRVIVMVRARVRDVDRLWDRVWDNGLV